MTDSEADTFEGQRWTEDDVRKMVGKLQFPNLNLEDARTSSGLIP